MHSYTESRTMPFTREQIFELVVDVESYHEFLPAWLTARVVERKDNELIVDQVVGLGAFPLEFVSHTSFKRPEHIHIIARDGPFRYLDIHWHFEAASETSCATRLSVDFELSSPLFEKVLTVFFKRSLRQILRSFEKRARKLYDSQR